jgi:hypothetical protein
MSTDIAWLKTQYVQPSRLTLIALSAQELAQYNTQQSIFQDVYSRLRVAGIEVTSMLSEIDKRNLVDKLQNLRSTDAITLFNGDERVVLYAPTRAAIAQGEKARVSTVENLANAEKVYMDRRGDIAFDVLSTAWTTAQVVYNNAGRLVQKYRPQPTETPPPRIIIDKPADVISNPPRLYNPGLPSSIVRRPYSNPLLAQSTLADEAKWNAYYVQNEKSIISTTNTEVQQTNTALGQKRQRDVTNVTVQSLKTVEDATRNVERQPVVKKMKTQPVSTPISSALVMSETQRKQQLDEFTQSLLRPDVTCDELRPLAVKLQNWFNNNESAITAYITQQVVLHTWNPMTQYTIKQVFKECIEREKALMAQQQQEAKRKPTSQTQPTFAADPPSAPQAVLPTADAAPKQYFKEHRMQVSGAMSEFQSSGVMAADDFMGEYTCANRIEFTAPLNDTMTKSAQTPEEAAKIQNQPAKMEHVAERANNAPTGIDQTDAKTNILNQADEGVATTQTTNDTLKKKPPVNQQRVPNNAKKPNKNLPLVVAGMAAAVGVTIFIAS